MLADVAKQAADLGMSLIARVEWVPGESGITQIGPMTSIGQLMTQYAAHSHGNIDKMILSMQRAGIDMSQSICLRSTTPSSSGKDQP
jgi:hypothetical protein